NANVQTLRSRREDDDVEVPGRITAQGIAQMLREKNGTDEKQVAVKYGVDVETLRVLERFLKPVKSEPPAGQNAQTNART
ncbi:hypothetical protein LPJ73_004556, partial [Coemansia sp. RSA 2703]